MANFLNGSGIGLALNFFFLKSNFEFFTYTMRNLSGP